MANPYCDALGIEVPRLERMSGRADVTTFSLLIVALLERGGPMSLREVAERFEQAGIASAERALESLQRCRPGRPPVWRDGDQYGLDPHDDELDLRVFMLGLRPPRVQAPPPPRAEPDPLAGPDQRLSIAELDEAWKDESLWSWARQRLVLAVIDAHGESMRPGDVLAFLSARTGWHGQTEDPAKFTRPRSAVEVLGDGRWGIAPGTNALASARAAVRERLAMRRRWARGGLDPAAIEAAKQAWEMQRAAHAGELSRLGRVIFHGFPQTKPEAVVLVDVGRREIETFVGGEISAVPARLDTYDVIAVIDVRAHSSPPGTECAGASSASRTRQRARCSRSGGGTGP